MTADTNHADVGDALRRQYLCECCWEVKEKSVLMMDAISDEKVALARAYFEIIRLCGKEIARTMDELEGGSK